jgi:hypothetical protein
LRTSVLSGGSFEAPAAPPLAALRGERTGVPTAKVGKATKIKESSPSPWGPRSIRCAGICRSHPQKLGFRILSRCDSRHEPTLRYVAAQFALHRRHPRVTLKLWSDKKTPSPQCARLGSTLLVEVARLAPRQEWFACLCWMLLDSSGQACAAEKVTPESRGAAFEDEGAIQDLAREDGAATKTHRGAR